MALHPPQDTAVEPFREPSRFGPASTPNVSEAQSVARQFIESGGPTKPVMIKLEIPPGSGRFFEVGEEFDSLSPEDQRASAAHIAANPGGEGISAQLGASYADIAGIVDGMAYLLNKMVNPALGKFIIGENDDGTPSIELQLQSEGQQAAAEFLPQPPSKFSAGQRAAQDFGFLPEHAPNLPVFANPAGGREDAVAGLRAVGMRVAEGPPTTVGEGIARGGGAAIAMLLPVVGFLGRIEAAGGVAGDVAAGALRQMMTIPGVIQEALAGMFGGGAREFAREQGAGPLVQNLAELAVPSIAVPTLSIAARAVPNLPLIKGGTKMAADIKRAVIPMTETGAREVAAEELRRRVGGEARAQEISRTIDVNERDLTPGQQSQEANLLAMEADARAKDPLLASRLDAREQKLRDDSAREVRGVGGGGDVKDVRTFFTTRLNNFKVAMNARIMRALQMGEESLAGVGPDMDEVTNSVRMWANTKNALLKTIVKEEELWLAVRPTKDSPSPFINNAEVRKVAEDFLLPPEVGGLPDTELLDFDAALRNKFGHAIKNTKRGKVRRDVPITDSVANLYGAYKTARRIARDARSGSKPNRNQARIANDIADAILRDLDIAATDFPELTDALHLARAHSLAITNTFDKGVTARLLRRNLSGDEAISPEEALRKTVGPGGPGGSNAARQLRKAAAETADDVADYLRLQFRDAAYTDGSFDSNGANRWLDKNSETMKQFPELRSEFTRALSNRNSAARFAVKTQARHELASSKDTALGGFILGQEEAAVRSVLAADDPLKTARIIANAAAKDESGGATRSLKAAFTDHLIRGADPKDGGLTGTQLNALLSDRNMRAALSEVFSPGEIARMKGIATRLAKIDPVKIGPVVPVLDSPANKLIEFVIGTIAARTGSKLGRGSGGAQLRIASKTASRAEKALHNLTNNRARQMLIDSIEDPVLYKMLLAKFDPVKMPALWRNKLAAYGIGLSAGGLTQEDEGAR